MIAVHGVADQQPNESNAAIASLLVQHGERPGTRHGRYTPFETVEVHLPQFPAIPPRVGNNTKTALGAPAPHRGKESRRHGRWQLRSGRDYIEKTRDALHETPRGADEKRAGFAPGEPTDAAGELGYQFMHMLLRDHEPGGGARSYVTTVLRGLRRGGPGVPVDSDARAAVDGREGTDEREVDVYEVYWADLSRPGQGALGFFSTAYQLLLHVATLGRQAVDDTKLDYPSGPWKAIRFVQWLAVLLLTLPIPLLNLVLLIVGFGVIPAGAIAGYTRGPDVALCAVLGAAGVMLAYLWMRPRVPARPFTWSVLPFVFAAATAAGGVGAGLAARRVPGWAHIGEGTAITIAWWVVGGGIAYWVGSSYQRLRTGALATTMAAYVLSLSVFAYWMVKLRSVLDVVPRLETATLRTMQLIFAVLAACLVLLWLCAIALVILWFVARWDAWRRRDRKLPFRDDPRWSRCRAALRTGRLAIGLSTGALYGFTLLAWAGIFSYTVNRFDIFSHVRVEESGPYPALAVLLPDVSSLRAMDNSLARQDLSAIQDAAKDTTGPPRDARADSAAMRMAEHDAASFTVPEYFQGLIAQSITPAAPFALLPILAAMFLLLWMALPSVAAEGNAASECTNPESRRMGRWLSRGLDSTRLVTHLFYAAMLILPAFLALVHVSKTRGWGSVVALNAYLELKTYAAAGLAGTMIAASAVFILGILVKFGGSALDVMLDVDNYLRTTPPESTPRARICQRYVSLLRHVAGAKADTRYDGVVIVAHSLGALISCDLLRFLQRERANGGDPALAPLGFGPRDGGGEVPITLVTMGNPVRQLLSRFFPHRYQWVRDRPDNGTTPLQTFDADLPNAAHRSSTPDARWLGVRRWVNVYRSGDYVGRSLWLSEWYHRTRHGSGGGRFKEPLFTSTTRHGSVEVSEGCIGAGAHTHYWDMSAPDVSEQIDRLIATA
ncbi:MAG TPA: hypothetical protein VF647_22095 [Longimicrobium sp.]